MTELELLPNTTTLVVFSHPNHELAVFGLLQRLRPHLVYLTDGGGPARVAQTREGLAGIGLLESVHFLDYAEQTFYDALLDGDRPLYAEVVGRVRERIDRVRPAQVLCDAVEFYNPLHDLTLPIVRGALRADSDARVFEVPLVHQPAAPTETYRVQRLPASRRTEQIEMRLTERELAVKLHARDHGYSMLQAQMGPVLATLTEADLATEVVAPARAELGTCPVDVVLRYEWRAEKLRTEGEIERTITYAEHYLPLASALFATS